MTTMAAIQEIGEEKQRVVDLSPLQAIRKYCVDDCCIGQTNEVRLCPVENCPLHELRFGKKPRGKHISTLGHIRQRCLDCSGFSTKEARECWNASCVLYPYRTGHNPNLKGKRGKDILQEVFSNIQRDYSFQGETSGPAMLSYLKSQIRERGIRRGMKSGTIHRRISAKAVRTYVPVPAKRWADFRAVARSRGIDFIYSIEDSTSVAGTEYHIHSNLSEAEDIL